MPPSVSRFVWYNSHGKGRNRFARFRRKFVLESVVGPAIVHLFADTSYQLFVNGRFAQFGPVRFDRRHPQYDSVDIAPFLVPGVNVIAILVKSFGCKTFKDNSVQGGFIAWGGCGDGAGGETDFRTGADSGWKVSRCRAFDPFAVKMSFALDPIDIYDQSKAEDDWNAADFDDSGWAQTVELEEQEVWGPMSPRSIPFMELTKMPFRIDTG